MKARQTYHGFRAMCWAAAVIGVAVVVAVCAIYIPGWRSIWVFAAVFLGVWALGGVVQRVFLDAPPAEGSAPEDARPE